jgi:transposase
LTAFGLAVEIGDWHALERPLDRRLPRAGAHRVLLRRVTLTRFDHQDRKRSRPSAADRSGLASPQALPHGGGPAAPDRPRAIAGSERTGACMPGGLAPTPAASRPWSPTPRSPASSPAGAGPWPSSTDRSDPLLPPSLIVSRRLSVSTSFVLAALRALHVDTSHAPRSDRQDGEKGG